MTRFAIEIATRKILIFCTKSILLAAAKGKKSGGFSKNHPPHLELVSKYDK